MMNKDAKIYVPGHKGMVGSSLMRRLSADGFTNLVFRSSSELNLLDQKATADFFALEKPEYVFLAAARVGGIFANNTFPAQFIYENLQIQNNIIHQSYLHGVKKLLFLGSSCIYPRECPQPMKEEYLLTGLLEPTNEPYAIAKIAGIKMCQSYNRQYGTNFIAAMPTNLYGPNDNFDLNNAHVFAAFVRKFSEAKVENKKTVTLWGTGIAKREFLHVDDMADACVFLMNNFVPSKEQNKNGEIFINIGTGKDLTVAELAVLFKTIAGFDGGLIWDSSMPDGMPQKLLDVSRIQALGWHATVDLKNGIKSMLDQYIANLLS